MQQPELQPDPAEIILEAVVSDENYLTFSLNTPEPSRALAVFTENWLIENYIARSKIDFPNHHVRQFNANEFIGEKSKFINQNISRYVINPCPYCNLSIFFRLDHQNHLKTCCYKLR